MIPIAVGVRTGSSPVRYLITIDVSTKITGIGACGVAI
jgi:hypothetical protein